MTHPWTIPRGRNFFASVKSFGRVRNEFSGPGRNAPPLQAGNHRFKSRFPFDMLPGANRNHTSPL